MEVDGKAPHFLTRGETVAPSSGILDEQHLDAAAEAQQLAAISLPSKHYQSGAARARHEEFVRRGRLTRELTALGLPPVYEHLTGVLVGQQVSTRTGTPAAAAVADATAGGTSDKAAARQRHQENGAPMAAWRRLRSQALNPAHNPVMARNIRLKAQLAAAAARSAAATKRQQPSWRLLRHRSALDEASRTIAKLQVVVGGAEPRRMSSAPVSKPYYPRRQRGGVPANETQGGDMWPGRLARRAAEQAAAEEEKEQQKQQQQVMGAAARRGQSAGERSRQVQIEELADVIVAAPKLGIHELGAYLPRELVVGAELRMAAASTALTESSGGPPRPGYRQQRPGPDSAQPHGGGRTMPMEVVVPAAELTDALHQLELCAAAGRAAVAAAEDDYGSHYVVRGSPRPNGRAPVTGAGPRAIAIPVLSPVATSCGSYGSGGHYLHEEGMAEDDVEGSSGAGGSSNNSNNEHEEDELREATADSSGTASGAEGPGGSRFLDEVCLNAPVCSSSAISIISLL
ncbi:hypothetical protein Vafri_4715 [Volvox africanus]|uniref:Uncharacterized protein n=1 Tax=Volvox africanus TaxID=51714 RepID=A0A8J4EXL1_9CHLO|nr:hypothetical protein Vafri_4715 [Volvox africanus]